MRQAVAFVILVGAAGIWRYNGTHQHTPIALEVFSAVPGYESKYDQGSLTWQLMALGAAALFVWASLDSAHAR